MSTIRSILSLSAVAAAVALTACGGGNDPVQTIADIPAVSVTPATLASAKAAVAGLVAAPAVSLPALKTKEGVAIPAGTTLKFTAAPTTGATASTLSGFSMASGTNTATGILEAGSCKFTVTGGNLYAAGTVLTFDPCGIDFNTAGVPTNGTSTNITASVNFGGVPVTVPNVPVSVTVVNGQAQISSGGTTIATGTVATGAVATGI